MSGVVSVCFHKGVANVGVGECQVWRTSYNLDGHNRLRLLVVFRDKYFGSIYPFSVG